MMEDLYAKFLPQFVSLAEGRLARCAEALAQPDQAAGALVIREMHAIAGEAGLLGLAQIMGLARQGEELGKRLRDSGATADADALTGTLQDLKNALALVGASSKPKGGT